MATIVQRFTLMRFFLAALLLVQGIPAALFAAQDEQNRIENVRFEVSGGLVRVYYDLIAPIDKVHSVRLSLRRESDQLFRYRPLNITGDVGTIVFPGQKRRIVWDYAKEFPDGLIGEDYYFLVEAESVETEGMSPWIWVGGGAVVVGGVLALLLLSGSEDLPPTPVPTGFPLPPGRPN